MCGIVGMFDISSDAESFRPQVLKMARKIRHRGPDWSGIYCGTNTILAHERLSIVDPESGGQPLKSKDRKLILAVNGEIYNHRQLREQLAGEYEFLTGSDCEVILALYRKKGINFLEELNGIFAFALYDSEKDLYLVARDHMGIIPLYMGWDERNHFYVASELKALEGICKVIDPFLPGHYLCSTDKKMTRWYTRGWMQYDAVKNNGADIEQLREGLEEAVRRQLMSDVPYGVLLSGGLDSSVISAIAKKFAAKRIETDGRSDAWWPQLHSFAVGPKGAPDLAAARKVADHIGTVHHEIHYTIQEGLDALRDVIYYLETYDVTTVRASTPMYLLSRVIKSMGIKMVLSGEGADELFGGYLYFHKAPDAPSTKRPCANWANCTCTTACGRTRHWRPGAWKGAYRSSTKSSWISPCVSIPKRKWPRTAAWKNGSSAKRSRTCCPKAWYGARRSSSPTEWDIRGLTP